jgi:hypothetical protein
MLTLSRRGVWWGLGEAMQRFRKLRVLAILSFLTLAACAPDIYDKAGGTQGEFNVDSANCQMFATGQPQMQAAQLPPTYTATTTYNGT